MNKRIGLVGHCGPDAFMLRSAVKYAVPDADVVFISDTTSLQDAIEKGVSVLLVNRLLDGYFFDTRGVELIRQLHESHPTIKTMLISNYPEAQSEAIRAGAVEGFGKSEIGTPKMRQCLEKVLKEQTP